MKIEDLKKNRDALALKWKRAGESLGLSNDILLMQYKSFQEGFDSAVDILNNEFETQTHNLNRLNSDYNMLYKAAVKVINDSDLLYEDINGNIENLKKSLG